MLGLNEFPFSMKVVFTMEPMFGVNVITEDIMNLYDLRDKSLEEYKRAWNEGYRYAHLFVEKEDGFGNKYFEYFTTEYLINF